MEELISINVTVKTPVVGHLHDYGFMSSDLQPLIDNVEITDSAFMVSLPSNHTALLHAISQAKRANIPVIERKDASGQASWGLVMTAAATALRTTGVVVDGDIVETSNTYRERLSVWCRGRSPITTKLGGGGSVLPAHHLRRHRCATAGFRFGRRKRQCPDAQYRFASRMLGVRPTNRSSNFDEAARLHTILAAYGPTSLPTSQS
ncbi:RraA family protein [Agrobacterium rosae]|uniref:Bifunctional hexulose-6-phosphate synthase/ribonuclease regulator n=1 Tax=Agrobacterium rosae TaxID=1972867 RepID=A0A1R3U728_9HYPH|nr:hypothetical protein [Agrobacterium rosae]SCX35115.1 bifunctional hexulose-6-phosphate synthase/ribonuclease regulator [Agrobacterium rosae]